MKKIILMLVVIIASSNAFAQLTERINNPGKIKTGTRPVAGNMGMFLSISTTDIKNLTDSDATTKIEGFLPVGSIKYYIKDDLVFRVGVNGQKTKTRREGEVDPNVNGLGGLTSKKNVNNAAEYYITPAIEKHFLNTNILDPYVVIGLPLGYLREQIVDNQSYQFGDVYNSTVTKKSLAYGLNLHLGLQAFIADLPLALGFELGYSGIGYRGEKYKHVENNTIGGVATSQEYFTYKGDATNTKYSSLKSNSFDGNGSIRVSLSYYFNK